MNAASSAKPFSISKRDVWDAYKRVKANRGAAGVDGQSIAEFDENLELNLYKLWNRLASGSYFPPPVRRVEIPKGDGRTRPLGIPTVADRIAQMVVTRFLEPILDPQFHVDSYGYRPKKSAKDALAVARQRCWQYNWVLDLDIKSFLDPCLHCPLVYDVRSNRPGLSLETFILKPFRLPSWRSTASSSPRFTRCNTVCRVTPRSFVASCIAR
jgi:RNA-directed DNA polymerase